MFDVTNFQVSTDILLVLLTDVFNDMSRIFQTTPGESFEYVCALIVM